ncbi:MAG: hypothetical protein Q8R38_06095 [Candidatus Omnitrophota bacterium]|nr:hypothetical protein [Candidatus Omnitrophota bacterium]
MNNNTSIYKPFVLAYLLAALIILAILFLSYNLTAAASMALLSLVVFAVLVIILGLLQPGNRALPLIAALVAAVSIMFISIYTKCQAYDTYKFLIMMFFYFMLGYFPALRLSGDHSGSIVTILVSIITGSLIFNVLAVATVILLGVTKGAFTALLISVLFITCCYVLYRRKGADLWRAVCERPSSEELQVISVILLLIINNALFLNAEYPHGQPDAYFDFARLLLANDFISFDNLPGHSSGGAHIVSLIVPPAWARLIDIDLGASVYLELLIGHAGLYICTYIFSKMLFKKHSYALGSLIFVALLGELFTYFNGLKHLVISHGHIRDFFPLDFKSWAIFTMHLRSRLSPLYVPWGLTTYIDSVKGYAALLLSMIIVFTRFKDLPLLILASLLMIAAVGNGEEYLLFTYTVFLFFYLLIDRQKLKIRNIVIGTSIGLLLGLPIYFYLSMSKGALNLVSNGTVYFRSLNDIGLWLYPVRKISMDLTGFGYLVLEFAVPATIFMLLAGKKSTFWKDMNSNAEISKFLFSFFIAALVMASATLFVGSTRTTYWNLNRFLNPFVFWLYLVGGAGFVYLVSKRFKAHFVIITVLILLAIFPTIRVAYSYFISSHERIISGIK